MGIYIKGMKMPKKCVFCPLSHWNKIDELTGCELHQKYIPNAEKEFWEKDRPDWCPLVEVPPHGRLIDADALSINDPIKSMMMFGGQIVISKDAIDNAPTIIEAEDGE